MEKKTAIRNAWENYVKNRGSEVVDIDENGEPVTKADQAISDMEATAANILRSVGGAK